jgi:hypothetical protein
MSSRRIIIPSWLKLSVEMQAETGVCYPAFVPLGNRPLFAHILQQYSHLREHAEFMIVLPPEAPELDPRYGADFNVRALRLPASRSLGETILFALRGILEDQAVTIHLADTLITDEACVTPEDTIYVEDRRDLHRWTTLIEDGDGTVRVQQDRTSEGANVGQLACVGVFHFAKGRLLEQILSRLMADPVNRGETLFGAIESYSRSTRIQLRKPAQWLDCGNVDSYYESRLRFQNLRHFNTLEYDSSRGLVTKRSRNVSAFRNQVRWFRQIPDELAPFLPRVFASSDGDSPSITMELVSSPTLSDLYLSKRLAPGAWNDVAAKLKHIFSICAKYASDNEIAAALRAEVYLGKTRKRLAEYLAQVPEARGIRVSTGGRDVGIEDVFEQLPAYVAGAGLDRPARLTPIHGDLCFSNLLYDIRRRHIVMIDPRGEFSIPGIYGDPAYDKAKLMHSYAGGYDYIVTDHFEVHLDSGRRLTCSIEQNEYRRKVAEIFDATIFDDETERRQAGAIQALLFLSMTPLHRDQPQRQLAMLHTGLRLFMEAFEK